MEFLKYRALTLVAPKSKQQMVESNSIMIHSSGKIIMPVAENGTGWSTSPIVPETLEVEYRGEWYPFKDCPIGQKPMDDSNTIKPICIDCKRPFDPNADNKCPDGHSNWLKIKDGYYQWALAIQQMKIPVPHIIRMMFGKIDMQGVPLPDFVDWDKQFALKRGDNTIYVSKDDSILLQGFANYLTFDEKLMVMGTTLPEIESAMIVERKKKVRRVMYLMKSKWRDLESDYIVNHDMLMEELNLNYSPKRFETMLKQATTPFELYDKIENFYSNAHFELIRAAKNYSPDQAL